MRDNVLNEISNPLIDQRTGRIIPRRHEVRRSHRIVRDPKDFTVQTIAETKKYQMVYEKRVIDSETFMTYPYGYGEIDMEVATVQQDIHTLLDL